MMQHGSDAATATTTATAADDDASSMHHSTADTSDASQSETPLILYQLNGTTLNQSQADTRQYSTFTLAIRWSTCPAHQRHRS